MREILFRGKDECRKEWIYGSLHKERGETDKNGNFSFWYRILGLCGQCNYVIPETVGEFSGLYDKNGTKIFEGDIVQYNDIMDFDCQSIVRFGEYKQDGSGGEYSANKCLGFYVNVDNFTCPDWCENEPDCYCDFLRQQNLLEVAKDCEVIGNIHDNPELMKEV